VVKIIVAKTCKKLNKGRKMRFFLKFRKKKNTAQIIICLLGLDAAFCRSNLLIDCIGKVVLDEFGRLSFAVPIP